MNDVNGFSEDHRQTNYRIAFQIAINLAAGAAALYAYVYGFKAAKLVLGIVSPAYLALIFLYNLWNTRVTAPTFYRGSRKTSPSSGKSEEETVWLSSELELPAASYVLSPTIMTSGKPEMKPLPKFRTCIGSWVTEDGYLDAASIVADLSKLKFTSLKSD